MSRTRELRTPTASFRASCRSRGCGAATDTEPLLRVREGDLTGNRLGERRARAGRPRRSRPAARRDTTASTKSASSRLSGSSLDDLDVAAVDRWQAAVVLQELPALHFLGRIVDRQVGRRLEEADPAHAVATDPAGRQVRDAAVREPQARVRDVDPSREDRHADGLDRLDLGLRRATARRRGRESSGRTRRRCRGCARERCPGDALR